MGKKTKKEKIIAQYRRRLQLIKKITGENFSQPAKPNLPSSSSPPLPKKQILGEEKFFLIDFKKSLFISFLIILLEFFLYYVINLKKLY